MTRYRRGAHLGLRAIHPADLADRMSQSMGYINGVNLLPSTGEFTYDTIAYLGQRVTESTLTLDQSLRQRRSDWRDAARPPTTPSRSTICRRNFPAARRSRWSSPGSAIRPISPPARSTRRRPTSTERFQQAVRRLRCLALFGPDAILGGPDPDPADRRRLHLRRHAVRPIDRPLHPRSEIARAAGRVLSVHPDDRVRRALARPHHL